MSTTNTPIILPPLAQSAVVQYLKSAQGQFLTSYNIREQLRQRDLAYYREEDLTPEQLRAKFANRTGDAKKLQNITVPVVMPQTESALSYLSDVFLTGYPIFPTIAPPENVEGQKQFDALLTDNSTRFGWPAELMKTLRKGLKYDLGAVEVVWDKKEIFNIQSPELTDISKGTPTETMYEGNCIRDLDSYNLLLDPRVSPEKNYLEGEYAGYSEMISRIMMKKRMEDLPKEFTMNAKMAFECGNAALSTSSADASYYVPLVNPDALLPVNRLEHDWMQWVGIAGTKTQQFAYSNNYEWQVLYARIIPLDFGLTRVPNPQNVQIWKFIIINRQVVIYAERQTNAHNYLPIIVCKPSNDGMGWQSKSFVENATPAQQVATSLMNSALASQRRKVYDRLLYDPTRVRKEDIDRVDPVARIPVKNSQFGKGFEGAVQPIPYTDNGVAEIIQLSQQVVQMGEITNGQNRVQQGQFQKGNKTRREFDTVMTNSNARQKMSAIALEYSFFTPIKTILMSNMLQYAQPQEVIDAKTKQTIKIDPSILRKQLVAFKMADGLISAETVASLDVANTVLQAAAVVPQVQMEYDIMGILKQTWAYQGLTWIDSFKRTDEQKQQFLADTAAKTAADGNAKPPQPAAPDAGAQGAM